MAANAKPTKKIHIDDWYYNDGRIDGMYGANAHYPGNFPVKRNRNPIKELLLRTRAGPRNMRLATHGDNVGAAKNPWVTKDQRNFFQIKHVPVQKAIKTMPWFKLYIHIDCHLKQVNKSKNIFKVTLFCLISNFRLSGFDLRRKVYLKIFKNNIWHSRLLFKFPAIIRVWWGPTRFTLLF